MTKLGRGLESNAIGGAIVRGKRAESKELFGLTRVGGELVEGREGDLISQDLPIWSNVDGGGVLCSLLVSPRRVTELSLFLALASFLGGICAALLSPSRLVGLLLLLLLVLWAALLGACCLFYGFVVYEFEGFVFFTLFKVEDGSSRGWFAIASCFWGGNVVVE